MAALQKMSPVPVKQKRGTSSLWLTAALLIFLASTVIAFRQAPRPDPFQPANFFSLDWWKYPLEKNAATRFPFLTADLHDVCVLPAAHKVWAVGKGGMIIHSNDGGRTWAQQSINGGSGSRKQFQRQAPTKTAFLGFPALLSDAYAEMPGQQPIPYSPQQQMKEGDSGNEPAPSPSGSTLPLPESPADPKQTTPSTPSPPSSRQLPPESHPETADLHGVFFVNEQEGWVVGANATILHTTDGGATWLPQVSNGLTDITAVQFLDNSRQGWAVGDQGVILHTTNGGETWDRQTSATEAFLQALQILPDGRQGWVVGGSGTILYTTDGGASWHSQPLSPDLSTVFLAAVHFLPDGRQGWTVGGNGLILHTADGGTSWSPEISGTQRDLRAVQFLADGRQGWIVGYGAPIGDAPNDTGTILRTTDGGLTWVQQHTGTPWQLESVQFLPDGRQGWAVGHNGTVLHTINGGETWAPQTDYLRSSSPSRPPRIYRIWPAPWYSLIGLALPLFLLVFALSRHEPAVPLEEASVADRLASDRPLEAGDPDPLEFNAIARGLSRFLRNEKTQPPLTIAITGEWGTGKSSLMNLLKADLERYGFHPVWFNAWHHQQEEQLLAALLEGVRHQGVPPWWHPEGVWFRVQLLALRGRRRWLLFLLISFAIVFSAGYFVAHPQPPAEALRQAQQAVEIVVSQGKALFFEEAPAKAGSPPQSGTESRSFFPLLGSISALLIALRKGFTAFGMDPANLLASVSGTARIRDLGAQAGFRQKFAAEFRDVTQALHPRTMLILIDDLDRCRPEKVLEVLEAINFLVSSGECYVVMGMALERVERCVGLGFKDIAEELVDDQRGNEHQTALPTGRQKRSEFARQYLEKLINIEVPVPTPTLAQSTQLLMLSDSSQFSSPPSSRREKLVLALSRVSHFWPAVVFALFLSGVFWLGMSFTLPSEKGMVTGGQPGAAQTATTTQPQPGNAQTAEVPSENAQDHSPVVFTPGQPGHLPFWLPLFPLLALLAAGIWMVWKSLPEVVVRDSPEFAEALKIWLLVIIARQHTPRSIKRFLNRVRYLAMCQRTHDQPATAWDRVRSWITRTPGFAQSNGSPVRAVNAIPESFLVALSALQHGYPEMNGQQNLLQNIDTLMQEERTWRLGQENRQVLKEALEAHEKQFNGSLAAMRSYWPTFLEVSKGIRVT
jgi:photosystem II stability/assembly factor-like uncharacterized protein